jgi:Ser/Thr protein kinase RdoA (MazF antagonist)
VQEFLPGTALPAWPSRAQADAVLGHLAAYDQALAGVDVPAELRTRDHLWTRVVSPGWLAAHLPGLVERGPGWLAPGPVAKALETLAGWATAFEALPRQVVHGDHGPDNVLYDGSGEAGRERQHGRAVVVLDFSPHHEPVLFGVACALYWFHVHPSASAPDASGDRDAVVTDLMSRLRSGLAAYAADRPWSAAERALVGPMLVREALRRLATVLAVAEEFGTPLAVESVRSRYAALVCVLDLLAYEPAILP